MYNDQEVKKCVTSQHFQNGMKSLDVFNTLCNMHMYKLKKPKDFSEIKKIFW